LNAAVASLSAIRNTREYRMCIVSAGEMHSNLTHLVLTEAQLAISVPGGDRPHSLLGQRLANIPLLILHL
jgi:hypothetical protein